MYVQIPHQQHIGENIHPGKDQHEHRGFLIAEEFGVGDVLRLVPRRPDLAGYLPDQRGEIQRPRRQKIGQRKGSQPVLDTGKGYDVHIHDHLHGIVGDQGQRQALLYLFPVKKPQGHQRVVTAVTEPKAIFEPFFW